MVITAYFNHLNHVVVHVLQIRLLKEESMNDTKGCPCIASTDVFVRCKLCLSYQ